MCQAPSRPCDRKPRSATASDRAEERAPGPAATLFAWGSSYVIVGASDAKLYQIDAGNPASITSVTLGDGTPTSVGAPSLDLLNSVIYVGTDQGVV